MVGADYVMKNCHLLAANRDNLDDEMIKQRIEFLKNTYGALIDIIDTPALPYSSTVIRENLKKGVSVEKMINPAVYASRTHFLPACAESFLPAADFPRAAQAVH